MSYVPFSAAQAAPFIRQVRLRNPVVHCLTNDVVQAFTANMLLAAGACPAMVVAREEVEGFAAMVDAVLVNVGTIRADMAESMLLAAASAARHNVPWVLDPVAVGLLPYRAKVAGRLLSSRPSAVRGNPAEILALTGRASSAKGADSLDAPEQALEAARELATAHACVVAVTGETDFITDGATTFAVSGGHVNLTRVTGVGCSLSAVVAAFIGSAKNDPLSAASAACLLMKRAGERAGKLAGLGSFAVSLLDHISFIDGHSV